MKRMLFLVALLFCALSISGVAQTEKPSLKTLPAKTVFSSPLMNLKIRLPLDFNNSQALGIKEMGEPDNGLTVTWELAEGRITVSHYYYGKFVTGSIADEQQYFKKTIAAQMQKLKAVAVTEKDVELSIHPGKHVEFSYGGDGGKNGRGFYRVFLAGTEQYAITALLDPSAPDAEALMLRSLESLELMNAVYRAPQEYPKTLPRTPAVERVSSDARDEGLKGKVKTVLRETEDIPRKPGKKGRETGTLTTFDERGYLISESGGILDDGRILGFIDGQRVSTTIKSEKADSGFMISGADFEPPPKTPAVKADPRYETKLVYTYDKEKRVVDESWFDNRGQLYFRTVYVYDKNEIYHERSGRDGVVYDKGKEILDANSLVVSRVGGQASAPFNTSTETFKYFEFDSHGNWTRRTVTGSYGNASETHSRYSYAEYRTITYYQ